MTNKNRLEGLHFRIMEVLEQAKGVPLTGLEITDRLHAGEYKDVLKDTLVFKVSQSIHSMKDKGKIVQSDAKDREGRLTYTLPGTGRLKFPPVSGAVIDRPPANPALPAAIAMNIKTVAPKEEEDDKTAPRVTYADGIYTDIIELLNKADGPMIVREIVAVLKDRYPASMQDRLPTLFAGHMLHLFKTKQVMKGRIQRGSGRNDSRGVQWEYFTRKTGKRVTAASDPRPAAAVPAEPAKAPAAMTTQPPLLPTRMCADPTPKPGLFRPVRVEQVMREVKLQFPTDKYSAIEQAAKMYGVPVDDFCRQAIEYALEHAG